LAFVAGLATGLAAALTAGLAEVFATGFAVGLVTALTVALTAGFAAALGATGLDFLATGLAGFLDLRSTGMKTPRHQRNKYTAPQKPGAGKEKGG
jgi:predicted histidine transporter YuiF (NhaC family)